MKHLNLGIRRHKYWVALLDENLEEVSYTTYQRQMSFVDPFKPEKLKIGFPEVTGDDEFKAQGIRLFYDIDGREESFCEFKWTDPRKFSSGCTPVVNWVLEYDRVNSKKEIDIEELLDMMYIHMICAHSDEDERLSETMLDAGLIIERQRHEISELRKLNDFLSPPEEDGELK